MLYEVITQRMFMEVIGSLARRDFSPLEQLAKNAPEPLIQRLLRILPYLDAKKTAPVVIRITSYNVCYTKLLRFSVVRTAS